jgi:glycerol uptake facilitator-like aquaporin
VGAAFPVYVGARSAAATGVPSAAHGVPYSLAQLGIISFAFMLVIVGAVYAIGHISGGHINPTVTVSFTVTGKLPWRDVPGYVAAQVAGAVAGAAAIYATLGRLAAVKASGGVTAYNPGDDGVWPGHADRGDRHVHTRIPPRCAAEPTAETAGRAVTCDLPKGHPWPALRCRDGWQY